MNYVVKIQQLQMECDGRCRPMARWMVVCDEDGTGSKDYRQGPFRKRDDAQRAAERRYTDLTPWIKGPKGVLSAKINRKELT